MTINVTQAHIDAGRAAHACYCPISLAAFDVTHAPEIYCYSDWLYIGGSHGVLPEAAQAFIASFDKGRPVQPFSFEVEL